jgi:hypothetical protein
MQSRLQHPFNSQLTLLSQSTLKFTCRGWLPDGVQ